MLKNYKIYQKIWEKKHKNTNFRGYNFLPNPIEKAPFTTWRRLWCLRFASLVMRSITDYS